MLVVEALARADASIGWCAQQDAYRMIQRRAAVPGRPTRRRSPLLQHTRCGVLCLVDVIGMTTRCLEPVCASVVLLRDRRAMEQDLRCAQQRR
jgi:hypothetical protein